MQTYFIAKELCPLLAPCSNCDMFLKFISRDQPKDIHFSCWQAISVCLWTSMDKHLKWTILGFMNQLQTEKTTSGLNSQQLQIMSAIHSLYFYMVCWIIFFFFRICWNYFIEKSSSRETYPRCHWNSADIVMTRPLLPDTRLRHHRQTLAKSGSHSWCSRSVVVRKLKSGNPGMLQRSKMWNHKMQDPAKLKTMHFM